MAEKILYYLGAGASAEALPLVKESISGYISLPNAMWSMAESLLDKLDTMTKTTDQAHFYSKIAEDLKWLSTESRKFTTIDTYAKYLYIKDRTKFNRLKFVMSIYFSLEQVHNGRLDNRYLVWLTSLLDREIFPDNIKIISWNYDFQIQLTAEIFRKEHLAFSGSGVSVHTPPLIEYFPQIGHPGAYDLKDIQLLHLNGIAGFYQVDGIPRHSFLDDEFNNDGKYLANFVRSEGYNSLHFAWEKEQQHTKVKILREMLKDVTIMVVIGYSFPFFNREMDREVYGALVQNAKLKKIYFQDPQRDGTFLRSQLGFSIETPIEHIKEVNALYIPFEL